MARHWRRQLLVAACTSAAAPIAATLLTLPLPLLAQTGKRFRIGCLFLADDATVKPLERAFLAGLRDLGYVVGRNLAMDLRYAGGDSGRLPALADELIALKPDVLFGIGEVAAVIRKKTATIPIVFPSSPDPVADGLVQSLRRPGANVTGIASLPTELVAKHIELLTELVPKLARAALFTDPGSPDAARIEQAARTAAASKGLKLLVAGAGDAAGVGKAFAMLEKERVEGIVVVATGTMFRLRHDILREVMRLRLPSVSALPPAGWAEAGGLLTYAESSVESFRHAATYVDRIFRGAKPGDLPVEHPTRFEFVLNMKAAQALGLKIPQSILVRADRVIE